MDPSGAGPHTPITFTRPPLAEGLDLLVPRQAIAQAASLPLDHLGQSFYGVCTEGLEGYQLTRFLYLDGIKSINFCKYKLVIYITNIVQFQINYSHIIIIVELQLQVQMVIVRTSCFQRVIGYVFRVDVYKDGEGVQSHVDRGFLVDVING